MPRKSATDTYEAHRERENRRSAAAVADWQDIAPLPRVANRNRRQRCKRDLARFCTTYLPGSFPLPFSPDHRKVIAKAERAVLEGGLFAMAMPRGAGKTTLAESCALWAILYGHRHFVVLIGAEEGKALAMLQSVKVEMEVNDLLLDDFPEACWPVRRLDRTSKRALGQKFAGEPTYIGWGAKDLVVATVPRSPSSGGVVKVAGLTASLRGLKHKKPDGRSTRPDLVIIDDPQTDDSAQSPAEIAKRERILSGTILGMAGPKRKMAALMPMTVILPGDLADKLLNPTLHPRWQGERTKLLYRFPSRTDLWEQYAELRRRGLVLGDGGRDGTEFYRGRREEMDLDALIAWPERFNPDQLSAVQYAMDLWIDDPVSFMSEYQNDPLPLIPPLPDDLTPHGIVSRTNGHEQRHAPLATRLLTGMIDVQQDLLYYAVIAWSDGFSGAVVDYGTWPPQPRSYFQLREASPTISQATGIGSLEGSLTEALRRLVGELLAWEWPHESGGVLKIERLLIDAGWKGDLVRQVCREHVQTSLLLPSIGHGIGAANLPMAAWKQHPGERYGPDRRLPTWVIRAPQTGRGKVVTYDSNSWKSFLAARLNQPVGEPGALTLFGRDPHRHRMLAEHCCAEKRQRVKSQTSGREVDQWDLPPAKPDNHLFDVLTGNCVAASIQGVVLGATGPQAPPRRKVATIAELREAAEARRRGR